MQRFYKPLIIGLILLATLGGVLFDRTSLTAPSANTVSQSMPGSIVPNVRFARLDGGDIALHSLKGRPIMLHFWASWCAPCRVEFPLLLKRIQADPAKPILVAISGDANTRDAAAFMAPFKQEFSALFASGQVLIGIDPLRKIIEGTFQTFQYPETILIDDQLRMQQKIIGAMQ